MPEGVLSLTTEERGDILNTAAARLGRPAVILEKDIWICWVLRTLFSIPDPHPMAFKGGTSLSKVYGIIDRFSEDIDVALDYRAFGNGFDPFAPGVSRSRIDKLRRHLESCVASYARDVVVPALETEAKRIPTPGRPEVRIGEDCETVLCSYLSTVEDPMDYLRSEVLLEFGGRNVTHPNERHEIAPDIAEFFPDLEFPIATVTVLSPSRTFWEKATLIHVECHRRRLAASQHRLSRHWFDLACLVAHDAGKHAVRNRALLKDVVRHKKLFFNSRYAQYDLCLTGQLRLIPDDDQLEHLRTDYDAMRTAGIAPPDAPRFDALIGRLRAVEPLINGRA